MRRFHLYLPEDLKLKLKEKSQQTDTPVAELIRQAIEAFLQQPRPS